MPTDLQPRCNATRKSRMLKFARALLLGNADGKNASVAPFLSQLEKTGPFL